MRRALQRAVGLSSRSSTLSTALRNAITTVDARSFEVDVLQSQQAVCLVYHVPSSASCTQFLQSCDVLSDQLNEEVARSLHGSSSSSSSASAGEKTAENGSNTAANWLKLCAIDGDTNKNLASAFSVERAKLPVTFFIMQATIVDKVVGAVSPDRMEAILRKFSEHYHKQIGVNFQASQSSKAPLAAATSADLTSAASTAFLQEKLMAALVGPDRIRLPEEAGQLEGLKKTLQQAKQKAFKELEELHHSVGMAVKRLSDEEMQRRYYSHSVFTTAAVISALEALFLARIFGSVGQMEELTVEQALSSVKHDFARAAADANFKRVLTLVDANVVRGHMRVTMMKAASSSSVASQGQEEAEGTQQQQVDSSIAFCQRVQGWLEIVDGRQLVVPEDFPSSQFDEMLTDAKALLVKSRKCDVSLRQLQDVKKLIAALLQMYPTNPQALAARSRFMSVLC